ncbi:MAG: DUF6537 domain-containing protein, partial [Novosphingobium sp.]
GLTEANLSAAIEFASLPAQIRGYGHVKEANVEKVRNLETKVMEKFVTIAQQRPVASQPRLKTAEAVKERN